MKRAIIAGLAIWIGYLELQDDLALWLPTLGGMDQGYVLAQIVFLAILAVIVFGGAISVAYQTLTWIFE